MKNKLLLVPFLLLFCSACSSINSTVYPDTDFRQYKNAYIQTPQVDEFNMVSLLSSHLGNMGFNILLIPPPESPSPDDMLVTFHYYDGWDMVKYLKSFGINFQDAKSKKLIASTSYRMVGAWTSKDYRIECAFDDLKEKLDEYYKTHRAKKETK
jgi:hypothetical protein